MSRILHVIRDIVKAEPQILIWGLLAANLIYTYDGNREKPVKHKKQAYRNSAGLQGITAILPYTGADG